jgi:hypothetical protein
VRQREGKRLGEEREARAHRSGQNQAAMPVEKRSSGEVFLPSGGVSGGEEKEGEGGVRGLYIAEGVVGKGVGFSTGGEIGQTGLLPCEGRSPAR